METTAVSHPTFVSVERFLDYLEAHLKSPRALVSCRHIIQLIFLADGNVDQLEQAPSHCYHDCYCFDSLHNYRTADLVARARERVQDEEIYNDWPAKLAEVIS